MTEEFSESILNERRQDEQECNSPTPRSGKEVRQLTLQTFVATKTALAVPKEHVASYIFFTNMWSCLKFVIRKVNL